MADAGQRGIVRDSSVRDYSVRVALAYSIY